MSSIIFADDEIKYLCIKEKGHTTDKNEKLKSKAFKAINNLFCDTSVSKQKCIENLRELIEDIEIKIECVKEDIKRLGK